MALSTSTPGSTSSAWCSSVSAPPLTRCRKRLEPRSARNSAVPSASSRRLSDIPKPPHKQPANGVCSYTSSTPRSAKDPPGGRSDEAKQEEAPVPGLGQLVPLQTTSTP